MDIVFPIEIQDLRRVSNVHTIFVKWFTSIKDIKDQLNKIYHCLPSKMHLFHMSRARALPNHTTLHDLGISGEGHVLRLAVDVTSKSYLLMPSQDIQLDDFCSELVREVQMGLDSGKVPAKTDVLDCTGGVYFMKASNGSHVAVFKPSDEEQGMPNNNKGHAGNEEIGNGLRPFFKPGQGYLRETAVYLLDEGNFCQVPPTTIAHCEHSVFNFPGRNQRGQQALSTPDKSARPLQYLFPKLGSLQAFVRASESFENIGPALISTFELQKIALLDIRMLNCDRNSSNILAVRKQQSSSSRSRRNSRSFSVGSQFEEHSGEDMEFFPFSDDDDFKPKGSSSSAFTDSFELIPIDHGYCLPTRLRIDDFDWAWFTYPQLNRDVDPEIVSYVMSINIEEQIAKLSAQLTLPDDSLFLFRIAHTLLREGIRNGLNLRAIAALIARSEDDVPSPLEEIISVAEENAHRAIETRSGRLDARQASSDAHGGDRDLFSNGLTPTLRKNTSLSSALQDYSENQSYLTKTLPIGGLKCTSAKTASIEMPPSPKRKPLKHRCVESEPILEYSTSEGEAETACADSNHASPNHGKKARKNLEIRYSNRKLESSNSNVPKKGITNPVRVDDGVEEYFVSDFSDSTHYPQQQESSDDLFDSSPKGELGIHSNFVKVGLSVGHSNFLEGAPLRTLHTFDSSINGPFLGSYYASGLKVVSKAGIPSNLSEATVTPTKAIAVPSSEADITSSEYNSSNEYGSPKSSMCQQTLSKANSSDTLSILAPSASVTPQPLNERACASSVNTTASERSVSFSPIDKPAQRMLKLDTAVKVFDSSKVKEVSPFSGEKLLEGSASLKPRALSSGDEEHRSNDEDDYDDHVPFNDMNSSIKPLATYLFPSGGLSSSSSSTKKSNSSSSKSSLSQPIALTRVVSLGSFTSPPIYDTEKSERQVTRLRNKRRSVAKTQEFQRLRLEFATKAVHSLVVRKRRSQKA